MKFLSLTDYEKTQHYKDRTPPWIKLYRDDLNDPRIFNLNDAQRYQYWGLKLLASECENKIPLDQKWIRQRLCLKTVFALKALLRAQLLLVVNDTADLPTPQECWTIVVDHHSSYSSNIGTGWAHGTPELHWKIAKSVENIGGWSRIGALRSNTRDLPFARAEFIKTIERL